MSLTKKNIIIGTAQFGGKYSVSSNRGVNSAEANKIIKKAYKNKINHLDTAIDYFIYTSMNISLYIYIYTYIHINT